MKKYVCICMVMLLGFAFTACEGPMGPSGESGEGLNWKVIEYKVQANEWIKKDDGDGAYFMCVKSMENLGISKKDLDFIYEYGNVFGYLFLRPGESTEAQTPLPYTLHLMEPGYGEWSETIYFDFQPETVAFYVQYSDFPTNVEPGYQVFRIVLNW
ncbi:hypothetical protein LJC38_04420 [Parabacteroides sp. OttesenSCG-928-K15]|nr:hypothetical protein [Parabacteroides sp. OttesenSCG-928-K15]